MSTQIDPQQNTTQVAQAQAQTAAGNQASDVQLAGSWLNQSLATRSVTATPAAVPESLDKIRADAGLPGAGDIDIMKLPTTVSSDPATTGSAPLTVGQLAGQSLVDRYRGWILQSGASSVNGTVHTWTLTDGQVLTVDTAKIKNEQARGIFTDLEAGLAVSDADLHYLESDEGSEDLWNGDDWDTWMRFAEKIPDSDPRAQLLRAMEAQGAISNGYQLLPYYESKGSFGSTHRTYPGGEENPTFQTMSGADTAAVLDPTAVSNKIETLFKDEKIAADYNRAVADAVAQLPDAADRALKLVAAIESIAYTDVIKTLSSQGRGAEAEAMIQQDIAALATLDPAAAEAAAAQLRVNSLGNDAAELAADPSKLDINTISTALIDSAKITIQALRAGANIIRHGSQLTDDITKLINETFADRRTVDCLSAAMQQLMKDASVRAGGGNIGAAGAAIIGEGGVSGISLEDFNAALDRTYAPQATKGVLSKFFTKMQSKGLWGSLSGAGCLASFGYKLSQGAWGPDSTPLERWSAARDILSFLSVSNHMAKGTATIVDGAGAAVKNLSARLQGLVGDAVGGSAAWDALGLSKSLPEVWGQKTFISGPGTLGQAGQGLAADVATQINLSLDVLDNGRVAVSLDPVTAEVTDRFAHIWDSAKLPENTVATALSTQGRRIASTVIKVLGGVLDLGLGIADIVTNALSLKRHIADGNGGMVAADVLGIGGGVGLGAAGAIGTLGLFMQFTPRIAAALGAASSSLFLAGSIFAVAGFIVATIVGAVQRHNELQRSSDQQGQWFSKLAQDGLAAADWGDRLEFLRYSYAWYGNDNTDPNKNYFEFQQAEWDRFKSTPGEGGSSLNRLAEDLHVYTDRTWMSPTDQWSSIGMDL